MKTLFALVLLATLPMLGQTKTLGMQGQTKPCKGEGCLLSLDAPNTMQGLGPSCDVGERPQLIALTSEPVQFAWRCLAIVPDLAYRDLSYPSLPSYPAVAFSLFPIEAWIEAQHEEYCSSHREELNCIMNIGEPWGGGGGINVETYPICTEDIPCSSQQLMDSWIGAQHNWWVAHHHDQRKSGTMRRVK